MVRINRRHIAALLIMRTSFFMNAYADEVDTVSHKPTHHHTMETAPIVVVTPVVVVSDEKRDKNQDKPFQFSAGVNLSAFYDLQKYGAQYKFAPSKWKHSDKSNPRVAEAFTDVYLSITKEMHIFGSPLTLNFLIEKEEGKTSLDLSNIYVENKWFKLGKAPGNFCTYLPTNLRYAAYQIAFKHDLGDGYSYTLAIEDAQGATIRAKEEYTKDQEEVDILTTNGDIVKVKTTKDKISEAKLITSKSMPQLALAGNVLYKQLWGNVQISALGTVVEYSYSTPDTIKHDYKYKPMFGAALSGKYIFVHNEEFEDKEETLAGCHVKYRSGLGGYHGEAGGLTEKINSNFCISKDGTKIVANLQSIGFGINAKHVWTKNWYSSASTAMLIVLNSRDIEDLANPKDKYNNALTLKLNPISYNIAKNFTVSPSYNLGIGNIIPNKKDGVKASTIQRLGIDISYDF